MEPFKLRIAELTKQLAETKNISEQNSIKQLIFWNEHWLRYFKFVETSIRLPITFRQSVLAKDYYTRSKHEEARTNRNRENRISSSES